MLARLMRLPLRRCLHTIPPRPSPSYSPLRFTLGASVVAAAYLAWHLTSDGKRISLDSATELQPITTSSTSPKSPSQATHSSSENTSFPNRSLEDPKPVSTSETGPEDTKAFDKSTPETDAEGQEGASEGAYNPVTGEINWDCPCLGGMAHGPCGPEFREAFSCFVFSEAEPKGINCVEKFQAMQNCFRAHPETYGDELMDEDEEPAPTAEVIVLQSPDTGEDGSGAPSGEASAPEPSGGST